MDRFVKIYGAGPLHLLSAVASLVVAAYAVIRIRELGAAGNVAVWFVGLVVVHDLLLLPLYSLVQTIAVRFAQADAVQARPDGPPPPRILLTNHLRVPVFVSALLLLLFFPSILQRNDGYVGASGLAADVYLERWLALTAALFLLSGMLYAIRLGRSKAAYRATAS